MKLKSKLPDVGETIFSQMTKLSNEHGAINLSQGFPDFDVDAELIELVNQQMISGNNQYAPMQGVGALIERIAEKTRSVYNVTYDPQTEITVTSGATEALFAAITAVVQKDDEVILFEPAYDSYAPAVRLNGGIPVFSKLKFPNYHIDWEEVANTISAKTKLIILNSPHNPSGTLLSKEDISALKDIIHRKNLFIVSDEVYEHIIFDGLVHESMLKYPELAQRSFVISLFGKTYHSTGWKIGYCVAPEPLTREFRKIHQFLTFSSNTPIQYAYAKFLQREDVYLKLSSFYQKKRDKFLSLMDKSRFTALPCKGTYFQMMEYSSISTESDMDFAKRLTVESKVASIPTSCFYHDGDDLKVLRFCFAKKDETLEQAAEILCKI
jgi:methionine aminotransferase